MVGGDARPNWKECGRWYDDASSSQPVSAVTRDFPTCKISRSCRTAGGKALVDFYVSIEGGAVPIVIV